MFEKLREKINIFIARSPKKAVLIGIMLVNVTYILLSAAIIFVLSRFLSGIRKVTFWQSVYYIITMILDAGCIDNVIADVGKAGTLAVIVCLAVIIMGMILFTGAVIGYVTNTISDFIDSKEAGKNKLRISNHTVIINWNARAAEIIKKSLFEKKNEIVIVFVPDNRDVIDEEINSLVYETILSENDKIYDKANGMPSFQKKLFLKNNLMHNNLTIIVREGDVSSTRDLDDISLSRADAVIVLENDNDFDGYDASDYYGNTQTVKALIQLTEMSEREEANHTQRIIVEVGDYSTENLIKRVIENKGKASNVVFIRYNELSGKILSQFSIMPELNTVYDYLLSNSVSYFASCNLPESFNIQNENDFIKERLSSNNLTIPLTAKHIKDGNKAFFLTKTLSDIYATCVENQTIPSARLKSSVQMEKRLIFVNGHNSKIGYLMKGFESFVNEWNLQDKKDIFGVVMVDDEETLQRNNYYKDYSFVLSTVSTDILDEETLDNIEILISKNEFDKTTVLVLSDDSIEGSDADFYVITHLIYIQELLNRKAKESPEFSRDNIDIVVEVFDPKNADIIRNYISGRVVICNKYLSSIISQIRSDAALYELYDDIFSNDSVGVQETSKELRIRSADSFFEVIPDRCTAEQLIRMVFNGAVKENKSVLIGLIRNGNDLTIFEGDQREILVEIQPEDKLVLLSNR